MSNIQVLGQFVTSLNRMSSEVMRVAFDAVGCSTVCDAVSPDSSGGLLHSSHGLMASAEHSGSSWTYAVVVVQRMHVLFGLFSGPAQVDFCLCFPSGDVKGCGEHSVFLYTLVTPHRFVMDVS